MRSIKFRAWDTRTKKIIPDWFAFAEDQIYNHIGDPLKDQDIFLPMQFTGLHDKNGKEIYEGDVLQCKEDGRLQVQHWVDELASFSVCAVEGMEVIGNIYENPELITNKQ